MSVSNKVAQATAAGSVPWKLRAYELAQLVTRGELSALESVEAHIARIEDVSPKLNAVVFERFDEARLTGRYKAMPILGLGVSTLGLFLMSTMGVDTAAPAIAGYLFLFGCGVGLMMQVLTVAVQNVVGRTDLGLATSGVGFFRSIGSVIGVAASGAIYANSLASSPGLLAGVGNVRADADAFHNVFLAVLPVAAVGFVLSWFLEEVPLRSGCVAADINDSAANDLQAA